MWRLYCPLDGRAVRSYIKVAMSNNLYHAVVGLINVFDNIHLAAKNIAQTGRDNGSQAYINPPGLSRGWYWNRAGLVMGINLSGSGSADESNEIAEGIFKPNAWLRPRGIVVFTLYAMILKIL